jgi:hypothetical protein
MKLLSLVTAISLGIAFSVGGQQQTTTDEQQQAPVQKEKKEKVEQTGTQREKVSAGETSRRREVKANAGVTTREGGSVTATSVFRKGQETHEHLALHRGVRETTDTHFSIGTHPRDWWLRTYSIAIFDGCHYYLADNGCWYPAYGFDPSCTFQPGVVYCD